MMEIKKAFRLEGFEVSGVLSGGAVVIVFDNNVWSAEYFQNNFYLANRPSVSDAWAEFVKMRFEFTIERASTAIK
jgi:hypothetical protein